MRVQWSLFQNVKMNRFIKSKASYSDPTKPPDVESHRNSNDESKRVETSQSFERLFDNETLSDVTINVNGGHLKFNAHKMILGLKSDVLAGMLNELVPVTSDGEKPTLCIQEQPECADMFPRFLYFIYSGTVWLHKDYVIALQRLAHKYGIRHLLQHCESYIRQILSNTLTGCEINTRGFAIDTVCMLCNDAIQSADVKEYAFEVLCLYFRDLVQSELWPQLSWQLVRDLIKSEHCQADENVILTSAIEWMKKNGVNDKLMIEDILMNIKYPLLHRKVLYVMQKNVAFKNFPKVQQLLNNAVKYHCFKVIPEARDNFVGSQFQPRRRFVAIRESENNNYTVKASETSMRYPDTANRQYVPYVTDVSAFNDTNFDRRN